MRRFLLTLLLVITAMSIFWIVAGRQVSEFADRFGTVEAESFPVQSISYKGAGDGGALTIDFSRAAAFINLAPLNPHIGTDKQNQLALADRGNVFAFGPQSPSDDDFLVAKVPSTDSAFIKHRHALLPWLDLNASTANHSLVLKRHWYSELIWTKPNGTKLKMLWQTKGAGDEILWHKFPVDDSAPGPANELADLIRVEISDASR